jgi:tetratricopeptide (TPR) repeat protein
MIVRNEAPHLAACLDSVAGLADEMVVVDTGSDDGTPKIAAARGATVHRLDWRNDFAWARNEGLRRCTGDWILVLDADERLDGQARRAIRNALADPKALGFYLVMRNYHASGAHLGLHAGAGTNPGGFPGTEHLGFVTEFLALRLFRRRPDLHYSGSIHETVEPAFEALGIRPAAIPAVIHHLGKADGDADRAKQTLYFQISQEEARRYPESFRAQFNLMQEAAMLESWAICAGATRQCLRLDPDPPLRLRLSGARAFSAMGQAQEALELLDRPAGPKAVPALRTVKGEVLAAMGRVEEAISAFLEAIDLQPSFTLSYLRLADLLRQQGDLDAAHSILEAGLDQNPRDLLLWEALVGLGASTQDLARTARDAWHALGAFPAGGRGLWHQIVARSLLMQGAQQEALLVLERGLAAFPGDAELLGLRSTLPS